MKTKILIVVLLVLMISCRTTHKTSLYSKEGRTEIERVILDSVKEKTVKESTKKVTDQTVKKQVKDFSGDIIIKGKADTLNPLVFHNVVSGDTLQSIMIRGAADYFIKNRYQKSAEDNYEVSKEEKINAFEEKVKTAISEDNIKVVASEFIQKSKEVKTRGIQAAVWIFLAVVAITSMLFYFIYKYFKIKK
ncbi:hypothetical protein V2E39_21035 [Chryseobacterium arthrosphaerae]|uniref:Lipoprotein n=1 Tax=Chryseobacterium arthrosphaerae TaxID=651561 RepID=A0ABU7R525_9FLAO